MFGRVFNRISAKFVQFGAAAAVVSTIPFDEKRFQKKPEWYKKNVYSLESRFILIKFLLFRLHQRA